MSMERDNEMIRSLMIELRKMKQGSSYDPENDKEKYHMFLLVDNGLILAKEKNFMGGYVSYLDVRITSKGHDFLDAAENENVWNKAKEGLKQQGFEISKVPISVLTGILKAKLNELLGI